MARKRTTVFADEQDLAVLKEAAARRGISEAEMIREALHHAALRNRVWSEPFFGPLPEPPPTTGPVDYERVKNEVYAEKAATYEADRRRRGGP